MNLPRTPARFLLALAGLLAMSPSTSLAQAPAPAAGKVTAVKVTGQKRLEEAALLARIQVRPGDTLSPWTVQRDLRSLYQSGLVDDVRVDVSDAPDGAGVVITFQVVEKPAVRAFNISGNKKIEEESIREVIDLPAFAVYNENDVTQNVNRIRDLYVEKGYYLAEVEPVVEKVTEDQVELTFKITEHKKVLVSRIDFTGNENIPDRKIRKYLQTKQAGIMPWLTSSGTFRQENLENDMHVARSVYLEEGYVDAQVDPPRVYLTPDKRHIYITMHVTEGKRYRIGKIDARGDWVASEGLTRDAVMRLVEGETLDKVERDNVEQLGTDQVNYFRSSKMNQAEGAGADPGPLETGEWFKLSKLQAVMQKVNDLYGDQGYAFVNVVPQTEPDPERQTVDLTFEIEKGGKVRIERIHITGNDPTFDKVVRREIPLNEGDLYSTRAIQESRARLLRLGFFENVNISTPKGTAPDTMDMNVEVSEQPTGSFSVGAGFSNLENFMLTLNVSKNNFLGLGYSMAAAANVSSMRQQGNLSFADPYFLDTRWTLAVSAYSLNMQYIEDEFRRGGSLSVGRYLDRRDDVRLNLEYSIEDSGLHSIDAYKERLLGGELYRSGLTSTMGLNLLVDKRNNRIQATRGLYASLSSDLSGGVRANDTEVLSLLGGDFYLWESKFNFRYYRPVVPKGDWLIFKYNNTLGYIRSTDGTTVPYIHRYRAGGINSVRGYDWYSLGPSIRATGYRAGRSSFIGSDDPSNADDRLVVGGTEIWVNNFELESPIVKAAGISAVVFFDAGNAFGDPWGEGHISLTGLRASYGLGVRWFSPLGPLRFEYGFPIAPEDDERKAVFDFSIGSFF